MNFLSIIKRVFSLLLCLIFIAGFAASATTAAGGGDGGEDVSPYTIIHDEVLSIPIGTGNGQVGYDFGDVPLQIRGPGSFYVDESGWIAVLDSENSRILMYVDGQYTNMRSLPRDYYATKSRVPRPMLTEGSIGVSCSCPSSSQFPQAVFSYVL